MYKKPPYKEDRLWGCVFKRYGDEMFSNKSQSLRNLCYAFTLKIKQTKNFSNKIKKK